MKIASSYCIYVQQSISGEYLISLEKAVVTPGLGITNHILVKVGQPAQMSCALMQHS